MRLTRKEVRDQLYDAVVPDLDSQDNIAEFNRVLNFSQERLINSNKWQGTLREVRFPIEENAETFTLPRRLVSANAVKFERDGWVFPGRIQNVWYSYLPYAQNLQDRRNWAGMNYGINNFSDLGDGWPTVRDSPYEFYYIRLTITSLADVGKFLYFKGNDPNGQPIYSNIDGVVSESVRLTMASPTVQSVQVVSGQVSFVSKERTDGYVLMDAVDTVTGETTRIGYYEPGEETISLRRYRAYTGGNADALTAICQIRYVPCQTDTDEVIPANLGALRNALAGIVYETKNDPGRRDESFNTAYGLLNDELKQSFGGAQFHLRVDPATFNLSGLYYGM